MSSEDKRAFLEISHAVYAIGTNASVAAKDIRGAAVLKTKIPGYLSLFASLNLYKTEDKEHFYLTGKGKHMFFVMMDRESTRGVSRTAY